jgi:hypothetical protein
MKLLQQQRDVVALEAFTAPDLSGLVNKVFPTIESGIAGFRGMFTTTPAVGLTSNQRDFLKHIEKERYTNMMPLAAFVPEGLKVSYLEYAMALFAAAEHASHVPAVINDFATFLASLVSNRAAIFETTSKRKQFYSLKESRDAFTKAISKCFDGTNRSEVKIENVIDRNADWAEVLKHCDTMSRAMNSVSRKELNRKIEECTELLERIGKMIQQGHFDKVSPEVVMDLSEGAYQVASELEFYSVMFYRVEALCQSVDRTMKHVEKVLQPA